MKEDKGIFLKVDNIEPVYSVSPYYCSVIPTLKIPYLKGIRVWINGDDHLFECDNYTVCNPDAATEDGHRQAVALMNELGKMAYTDNEKLFGYGLTREILNHFSYKEIVEKLDAWKKEKETIRVRDEVYSQSMQVKFVVTKIFVPFGIEDEDTIVNGLKKDGTAVKGLLLCNLKKTGLHVDDLDSYLEV